MLKRPKSAVLLSLPYNFQTKQQAVDIKQKVKKSLLTFQTQESLDIDLYQQKRKFSTRSYVDNGPSLLNTSTHHYSVAEVGRTFRSLQHSRATTAHPHTKRQTQKQLCTTGLENYQRLKPCKVINFKSIQNLEECLNNARKQSKFIDRVFQNLSPRNDLLKKPAYNLLKRQSPQKQNPLKIKGQNLNIFQSAKVSVNLLEETPYKTNVFQPTLQRKGLQLLRKSKAYLMARG